MEEEMRRIGWVLIALTLGSCTPADDLTLAREADGSEWEERRARMNIRIQIPGSGPDEWIDHEEELTPAQLADQAEHHCAQLNDDNPGPLHMCFDAQKAPNTCDEALCVANLNLCIAQVMTELASAVTPVVLQGQVEIGGVLTLTEIRIPPQGTDPSAGLNEEGVLHAREALIMAAENLRGIGGHVGFGKCAVGSQQSVLLGLDAGGQRTVAMQGYPEFLGATMIEAHHLSDDAVDAAVADNLAAADAERSIEPDSTKASRAAWTAPVLSRAHAAHIMLGGDDLAGIMPPGDPNTMDARFPIVNEEGVCPGDALSDDAEVVVDLLRDASIDVGTVADLNVPLDLLLTGPGLVLDRLAERYDDTTLGGLSAEEFLDRVDIDPDAFTEARSRMRHEVVAFGRDIDAIMPPPTLVTSSPTGPPRYPIYPYYTGTGTPPRAPPVMHYSRLITGSEEFVDDRPVGLPVSGSAPPGADYARRGHAQTLDFSYTTAYSVMDTSVSEVVRDLMAAHIAEAMLRETGRVETCYRYWSVAGDEARIRVFGKSDPNEILLVDELAGLSCALEGHVEGVPCRLSQHTVTPTTTVAGTPTADTGFGSYVELTLGFLPYPTYFRYYVVALKPGGTPGAAGHYESLGTVSPSYWSVYQESWKYCHSEPFIPDLIDRAGDLLTPSPDDCTQPRTSCAGVPFDQTIPLEDELIDDGDPYETSWRYHIGVAREAARHADELGEMLINQGLTMDLRAEAALEILEDECGGIGTVENLFDGSLADAHGGACPTGTECAPDYDCMNSQCVLNPVRRAATLAASSHDERLLRDCLDESEDAIYPVVSLGTEELCYWYRSDDPSVICEGADPTSGLECPYEPATPGGCYATPEPPGGGVTYVAAPVSARLRIFGEDAGDELTGSTATQPLDCNLLRRLRRGVLPAGGRDAATVAIRRTNFLAIENVRQWAARIGWEGRPLDYSALTLDGSPWYGTGDPFVSGTNTTTWPCGNFHLGDPPVCDVGDVTSLFCGARQGVPLSCTNSEARIRFNDRMARAALALGITTGVGLGNFTVPLQYAGTTLHPGSEGTVLLQGPGSTPWRIATLATDLGTGTADYAGTVARQTGGPVAAAWTVVGYNNPATTPFSALTLSPVYTDQETPMSFLRLGAQRGAHADLIAEVIWSGMDWNAGSTLGGGWDHYYRRLIDGSYNVAGGQSAAEDWLVYNGRYDYDGDCIGSCEGAGKSLTTYWGHPAFGWNGDIDAYTANLTTISAEGIRVRDMWDALELVCEAARYGEDHWNCDPDNPPQVQTANDLPALRTYMNCMAGLVEQQGERILVQNLPARAVDGLMDPSTGSSAAEGGAGGAISSIRETLITLRGFPGAIAAEFRGFAADLELLEIALASIDARRELQDLNAASTTFSQAAACASSSSAWGAVASCANAAAQIVIAFRVRDVTLAMLDSDAQAQVAQFVEQTSQRQDRLSGIARDVSTMAERLNGQIASLDVGRGRASRALARATFVGSDAAGRQYNVNTTMRRQYNTLLRRYARAHQHAIRMTYIAKLALEQRLGMRLADLDEDMTLVEAPARWESRLCTMPSIDYSRIRDETELPTDDYADAYVGDYVRDLERVFESYRFDFPFTSTTDTAVISVRDDLLNVRRRGCAVESYNLLASSGDLQSEVWALDTDGCTPLTGGIIESCGSALPWPGTDAGTAPDFGPNVMGSSRTFRVVFGATTTDPISYTDDASLYQEAELPAGRYRLSWFGTWVPTSSTVAELNPSNVVDVETSTGEGIPMSEVLNDTSSMPGGGWSRYFRFFDITRPGLVRVRIIPDATLPDTPQVQQAVGVGGFMLESVSGIVTEALATINEADVTGDTDGIYIPRVYVETDADGFASLATCEDTDGRVFRGRWVPHCQRLCGSGFAESCTPADDGEPATNHCYRELQFTLDQAAIERGEGLTRAGFAYGNFNYRIDSIAVNVVGSASRVCEDEAWPSTCHASGSVPFSLRHDGPYTVRNHVGEDYHPNIYPGRIEHARALASERYVTNPISSSDEGMLASYTHSEWRGRPLDGQYVLRVWDEPAVNFQGIEDVQIVLRYRYWTRAE